MSDRAFIWTVALSCLAALVVGTLVLARAVHAQESGIASVYGGQDGLCGHTTASGERFNCSALTAASRHFRLGSHVRVCHGERCVRLRINDRGPYVRGRIIDLSPASARALGVRGLGRVTVEAAE